MPGQRHTAEQIVRKLREAEVELAKGQAIKAVCKQLGITDQTYYRWRKEYGGLQVDQAKRLKDLERRWWRATRLRSGIAPSRSRASMAGTGTGA